MLSGHHKLKPLSKAPHPAAAQWPTAAACCFHQAEYECNLSAPSGQEESSLSQHVWVNEILTRGTIRQIVSHFPFIV